MANNWTGIKVMNPTFSLSVFCKSADIHRRLCRVFQISVSESLYFSNSGEKILQGFTSYLVK